MSGGYVCTCWMALKGGREWVSGAGVVGEGGGWGARLLCEYLGDAPGREVCEQVAKYEHAVKAGSYESLIEAQYKFDLMEAELRENAEFKADWEGIKRVFDV